MVSRRKRRQIRVFMFRRVVTREELGDWDWHIYAVDMVCKLL